MNEAANEIREALQQWMAALDRGDLDTVLALSDDNVLQINAGAPTTIGVDAVRAKYEPRLAASTFTSGWKEEHLVQYGDIGVVVGHYTVSLTSKDDGTQRQINGRLCLTYRRDADGAWKVLADIDND